MSEFYAERFVTAMGQPLTQADRDEFMATFAGRLSAKQIDKLIRWVRRGDCAQATEGATGLRNER